MERKHQRALGLRALIVTPLIMLAAGCGTIESDVPQTDWTTEPVQEDVEQEVVLDGLQHPWAVAWLPDGGILVTERAGRLLYFETPDSDPEEVRGVPEVYAEGQGGLLDVVLHPSFEENRLVYLAYSVGTQDANRTRVSRFRLVDGRLSDPELVFQVQSPKSGEQHFGSRLLWLPDGTLLVSIGDGGNPPLRFEGALQREQAQNRETLFGGVVRLNDDGSVPGDSPFVGSPEARDEFFTVGNRNIQGLAYDETTGRIWASEHGSRGGDELNELRAGENYGWPLVSHSREYVRFTPVAEHQSLEGYADPAMVWMETVAPSGLAIRDGRLYAGGLVSEAVHEIVLDEDGAFDSQRVIPIGVRVRDVRVGPDGALYVLTDEEENGRLIRMALPAAGNE